VIARLSTYELPPERLTEIGEQLRAVVRARRGGYDPRILAAFLGVDRESGHSVAVTIASDDEALLKTPAEPEGFEAVGVTVYDVVETYVAEPKHVDASVSPRLHVIRGEAWREPDELVDAAFALTRATEPPLLVSFAEWPEWTERVGGAEVYDLEYFMVRHGAPVR
jgi:hypothetical protein